MKFLFLVVLSVLVGKTSYANIEETFSETVNNPLPEQTKVVKKPAVSTANDRIAKACLITAAELQENHLKATGQYAANLQDLKWPSDECFKNFILTIQTDQQNYTILIKNKKVAWQLNQDNVLKKVDNL
jgi:hypothetical protein